MRGFIFTLDSLIASLIVLMVIVIALNHISNIASTQRSKLESLEIATLELSEEITTNCQQNGGVAFCRSGFVYVGEFDEVAMQNFQLNKEQEDYLDARGLKAEVTFDASKGSGSSCVVRVGIKRPSGDAGVVKICVDLPSH